MPRVCVFVFSVCGLIPDSAAEEDDLSKYILLSSCCMICSACVFECGHATSAESMFRLVALTVGHEELI